MRTVRTVVRGIIDASIWPGYLALAAYAARQAPWPRSVALLVGSGLGLLSAAAFAANLVRWFFGRRGWAEASLGVPPEVTRQGRRVGLALIGAQVLFLLPCFLLSNGLVAPGGRPAQAPTVVRGLVLAFEFSVLAVVFRLSRPGSPVFAWLTQFPDRLGWLTRRRRALSWAALVAVVAVIVLDARGYSFSARRLASGTAGSMVVGALCWVLYKLSLRAIGRHTWRWVKLGKGLGGSEAPGSTDAPDDLGARLRRLSAYLFVGLGLVIGAWVWDVDLAFFEFISRQGLWSVTGSENPVTVGDLTKALVIFALAAVVWRHISTFFAVAVFPRMPDDPGVRFAVVTLCRYAVLGIGLLSGLSAVHLGLEKIGVVLAALGVGLGFGLQEIVSNFVCGIILLLERPIRVGDVVTVANMTGKVDRINIRATTITNGDNQSMIIPNRAFITGDLVNWTLKDKIIRVSVRVRVAHGSDPERVSELLLGVAREDPDVLRNPLPAALMEEFGNTDLTFVLHTHVPDPSLGGRVKHRLFSQIQKRFAAEGIEMPLPIQKLLVKPFDAASGRAFNLDADSRRFDGPSRTPPLRHWPASAPVEEQLDEGHRGVDE